MIEPTTQANIDALKTANREGALLKADFGRGLVTFGVSDVVPLFKDAYAVVWFYVDGVRQLARVRASKLVFEVTK